MTTTSPADPRPNRLSERGRWALRESAPMLYHVADAFGVHPSQLTRELSGERPSPLSEPERRVYRLACGRKTSATPFLFHLHTIHQRGLRDRATEVRVDPWTDYLHLCATETEAQGPADVAELLSCQRPCRDALSHARDELARHGARIIRLVDFIPTVVESLS